MIYYLGTSSPNDVHICWLLVWRFLSVVVVVWLVGVCRPNVPAKLRPVSTLRPFTLRQTDTHTLTWLHFSLLLWWFYFGPLHFVPACEFVCVCVDGSNWLRFYSNAFLENSLNRSVRKRAVCKTLTLEAKMCRWVAQIVGRHHTVWDYLINSIEFIFDVH